MGPNESESQPSSFEIDLTPALRKRYANYPKKPGRYSASEMWAILNNYTSPEDFLNKPAPDFEGMMKMWMGIVNHEMVQELLIKDRCEVKREYYYYGPGDARNFSRVIPPYPQKAPPLKEQPLITIVAKADYLPEEEAVWEFKTSAEVIEKAKSWHEHQAKLYTTMFEKPIARVLQPVTKGDKLLLKEIGRVERDDVWFEKQVEKLLKFDAKVRALMTTP